MPIDTVTEMTRLFGEAMSVDPISAGLFIVGNVLLLGSIAAFGILTLGSLLSVVTSP